MLKNKNSKYVRKWVEGVAEIKAVISLPEEAFQSFGAMVKTSLCVFQKLKEGATINQEEDTLLIELENVGYDATGRRKAGSEIVAAAELFHKEIKWK